MNSSRIEESLNIKILSEEWKECIFFKVYFRHFINDFIHSICINLLKSSFSFIQRYTLYWNLWLTGMRMNTNTQRHPNQFQIQKVQYEELNNYPDSPKQTVSVCWTVDVLWGLSIGVCSVELIFWLLEVDQTFESGVDAFPGNRKDSSSAALRSKYFSLLISISETLHSSLSSSKRSMKKNLNSYKRMNSLNSINKKKQKTYNSFKLENLLLKCVRKFGKSKKCRRKMKGLPHSTKNFICKVKKTNIVVEQRNVCEKLHNSKNFNKVKSMRWAK